jgi:hypothetical protein
VFWYPNEITRKRNMISIIKIARELGLYKDNYSNSNGKQQTTTTIETDEEDDNYNDTDQPPMFLGEKKAYFPKRRRSQHCDTSSMASLVGTTNLDTIQIPNQSSYNSNAPNQSSFVETVTLDEAQGNCTIKYTSLSSSSPFFSPIPKIKREDDEDKYVYCQCGSSHCNLRALESSVELIPCPNASSRKGGKAKSTPSCDSGIHIFKSCQTKICASCYQNMFSNKENKKNHFAD